jgi:hypothetical protein
MVRLRITHILEGATGDLSRTFARDRSRARVDDDDAIVVGGRQA